MEKYSLKEFKFANREEYLEAIKQPPADSYIYDRDGIKYVPIHIVEALADIIYQDWNVVSIEKEIAAHEVKGGLQQLSVLTVVTIEATPSYPDALTEKFSGCGAVPLKTSKNAYEMDFPGSKAKAITNAFSEKGNLFGRSVNRKDRKKLPIPKGFRLDNPTKKKEDESK